MAIKKVGPAIIKTTENKSIFAKTIGQRELVDAIENNKVIFVTGPAGSGKAQPLDSKILTNTGWITMGELSLNDEIISIEGTPTKVIGIYPQGEKEVYKVTFDDGSATECCKEHLWEVTDEIDRGEKKPGKVKNLEEIMKKIKGHDGRKNYAIPMVKPVKFKKQIVKLDPYALGILIGDGHFNEYFVNFASADKEIVNSISESVDKLGLKLNKDKSQEYSYRIVRKVKYGKENQKNLLLEYSKEINLWNSRSNNKHIPDKYKFNTIEVRIALLQGLMDSDGSIDKKGVNCQFSTVSKQLAEDFEFLVRSLGGKVSINTKTPTYTYKGEKKTGQLCYIITLKLPKGINPFRLSRKSKRFIEKTKYLPKRYITDVKYIGKKECQCIMVEHPRHLYITDDFIVTHNTFIAIAMACKYLLDENSEFKKLKLTRPILEAEEELGFLPGSLEDKVDPFMRPLHDSIDYFIPRAKKEFEKAKLSKKDKDLALIEDKSLIRENIEICPLAYMRGRTFNDSIIILDEGQNTTIRQMKMILTRMGHNSKIIVTGDIDQVDLPSSIMSGLQHAIEIMDGVNDLAIIKLTNDDVVRNPMVKDMLDRYNKV